MLERRAAANVSSFKSSGESDAQFPIVCETCLGANPYVRMTRQCLGSLCNVCQKPFTEFTWIPGRNARRKRCVLCQSCARLKHVCQVCILDLDYQVPVEARDKILEYVDNVPQSGVNQEYYLQQRESAIQASSAAPYRHKLTAEKHQMLLNLNRSQKPYYDRNRPNICSFWVKGECLRGEECPFRHEKPSDPDDPLSMQNMKDRFHGQNDPVADKLLRRLSEKPSMKMPEDVSITTLYLCNLPENVTDNDIKGKLYQYGEIRSINLIAKKNIAFVEFVERSSAEEAFKEKSDSLFLINSSAVKVAWARRSKTHESLNLSEQGEEQAVNFQPVPGLPLPVQVTVPGIMPLQYQESTPSQPPSKSIKVSVPENSSTVAPKPANNKNPVYYPSQQSNYYGETY